jgi:hypothetical protein
MIAKKCSLPKQAENRVVSRLHDALVKDKPLLEKCDKSSGSSLAKIYLTFCRYALLATGNSLNRKESGIVKSL